MDLEVKRWKPGYSDRMKPARLRQALPPDPNTQATPPQPSVKAREGNGLHTLHVTSGIGMILAIIQGLAKPCDEFTLS